VNRDFSYLQDVLDAACGAARADLGAIVVLGQANSAAYIAAYHGFEPFGDVILPATQVRDPTTAAGQALAQRELVFLEDVETYAPYAKHRRAARQIGYRGILAAPLIGRSGEAVGVMALMFQQPLRRSAALERTAALHGTLATLVVECGRLKDQLARCAGIGAVSEVPDRDLKTAIRELRVQHPNSTLPDRIRALGEQYVGRLVTTLEHLQ
jgi:GAF domain-containing protein